MKAKKKAPRGKFIALNISFILLLLFFLNISFRKDKFYLNDKDGIEPECNRKKEIIKIREKVNYIESC